MHDGSAHEATQLPLKCRESVKDRSSAELKKRNYWRYLTPSFASHGEAEQSGRRIPDLFKFLLDLWLLYPLIIPFMKVKFSYCPNET